MKRQLVFLITSFSRGGAEAQLIRLTCELKDRGWGVRILVMLHDAPVPEALSRRKIEIAFLGMKRGKGTPLALFKVACLLRRWGSPVLITFNYPANMLGRLAGTLAGVPVIVSSIRNEHFGGRMRDRLMRLTRGIDAVTTTNSKLAAQGLVRRRVVSSASIRVIANGIAVDAYSQGNQERVRMRKEIGVPDEVFLWLAVGRLEPQKDYPNLFSAVEQMDFSRPYMLCIAGDGSLAKDLGREIEHRNLNKRIRLLGLRDDIPSLLGACDAFVLCSAWEGLPNVIMEAFAAAKPTVSTRVGGAAELVQEGESGFLVPPRSPVELERAMERMMTLSAEERSLMGRTGQTHIRENFGIDRVVDAWEELFLEKIEAIAPRLR